MLTNFGFGSEPVGVIPTEEAYPMSKGLRLDAVKNYVKMIGTSSQTTFVLVLKLSEWYPRRRPPRPPPWSRDRSDPQHFDGKMRSWSTKIKFKSLITGSLGHPQGRVAPQNDKGNVLYPYFGVWGGFQPGGGYKNGVFHTRSRLTRSKNGENRFINLPTRGLRGV